LQVRVALGNGDGTFQPATTYFSEGLVSTIVTADLNRDGVPDLVVGGDHTFVFLGNGNGTFGAPSAMELASASRGSVTLITIEMRMLWLAVVFLRSESP
jgi:hypothetical protein